MKFTTSFNASAWPLVNWWKIIEAQDVSSCVRHVVYSATMTWTIDSGHLKVVGKCHCTICKIPQLFTRTLKESTLKSHPGPLSPALWHVTHNWLHWDGTSFACSTVETWNRHNIQYPFVLVYKMDRKKWDVLKTSLEKAQRYFWHIGDVGAW